MSADFQRAGFVYRMGKSQWTQLSKNRNPSITVRPDNRWQEGHGLGLQPQGSQMLTWSLGTYRLGQQFPNHPVTGGILGALLSTTPLMTQWLGAPRVQVAHGAGVIGFHPRCSRRETLAGSLRGQELVPLGYFRLVIAGCGFYSPLPFDSNVV